MTFGQQTFLGASIRTFNGELGWGDNPTSLTVHLVEDERNSDNFNPPAVGFPVEFIFLTDPNEAYDPEQLNGFYFAGILDNISDSASESENKTFSVTITDPRRFLDGIQLIIGDYADFVNEVENIYNIFALYEDVQYGASLVNSVGMRSDMILQGLEIFMSGGGPNNIPSKPIRFAGVDYYLDLTELPLIQEDYRIGGNVINLLDFVNEICDIANVDYIVNLIKVGSSWVIKFRTINRSFIPDPNAIINFVNSVDGVSNFSSGLEYNYSPSSKFLIGAPMDLLFFRPLALNPFNFVENTETNPEGEEETVLISLDEWFDNGTIAKFWGEDLNQNLIFGKRPEDSFDSDDEIITVSANEIGLSFYTMTVGELRAAVVNQDSWETYITINDYDGSPHEGKSDILNLRGELRRDLQNVFVGRPLDNLNPKTIFKFTFQDELDEELRQYVSKVYGFVRRYATEFFGVKFSVSIPNSFVKVDSEDFRKKETSLRTVESGYLEDSEIISAINNGDLPEFFSFVQDDNGKIIPYVKFNDFNDLDLSNLRRGVDYVLDYQFVRLDDHVVLKTNVFVRCQIDEKVYFGNGFIGEDPRVVITLPAPIYLNDDAAGTDNMIRDIWLKLNDRQPRALNGQDKNLILVPTKKWKAKVSSDNLLYGVSPKPLYPDLAVVPLRNTLMTYGPWYASGESGKVDIEYNPDLNPWNFGGFANMNEVGARIVQDVLINDLEGVQGTITIPGVGLLGPGYQIPGEGPYITGLSVNIGNDGVTTNYRYGKWALKTGKMLNYQIERFKRIYSIQRNQNKTLRDLYGTFVQNVDSLPYLIKDRENVKPRRERPKTSSSVFIGDVTESFEEEDDRKFSSVASIPLYQVENFAEVDFEEKGAISFDGLFRPYIVNGSESLLPVYDLDEERALEDVEEDENGSINVYAVDSTSLFPFKLGHDVSVVFKGEEPSENIANDIFEDKEEEDEDLSFRGIALKGPVVVCGWGFDVNEKPCPAKLDEDEYKTEEFEDDYLSKFDTWKVGPLDFRWDEKNKVWTSPKQNIIKIRNDSDAPRERGEVLKVNGEALTNNNEPRFLTSDIENKIFSGIITDGEGPFVILCDDVNGDDKEGVITGYVYGKCLAKVDVTDENHTHARLEEDSYNLVSDSSGPVQIIFSEGTGVQLCLVIIGGSGEESDVKYVIFELTDFWTNGVAESDFFTMDNELIESSFLRDPLFIAGDLKIGDKGYAIYQNGMYYFVQATCPSEEEYL